MAKWSGVVYWSVLLVLCCAVVAFGQADDLDQDIHTYTSAFNLGGPLIMTVLWSLAYLPIYMGGLIIPQHYMERFTGFELSLTCWTAALWLGGLGANYVGYAVVNHFGDAHTVGGHWLAVLLAAVIIFAWCTLMGLIPWWADLTLKESLLIAGIITVLCAPYFGSTWRFERPKPAQDEARVQVYQVAEGGIPASGVCARMIQELL